MGTLSQALARQKYVSLISELFPTWQPDLSIYKPQGTPAGPVFSSLAHAGGGIDLPNTLVSAALECRLQFQEYPAMSVEV